MTFWVGEAHNWIVPMLEFREGFDEIWKDWRARLHAYALRLAHDDEVAEELVQEALFRFLRDGAGVDSKKIRPWLFRVVRNLYMDRGRKRDLERKFAPDVALHEALDGRDLIVEKESIESDQRLAFAISNALSPARKRFFDTWRRLNGDRVAVCNELHLTRQRLRRELQLLRNAIHDAVRPAAARDAMHRSIVRMTSLAECLSLSAHYTSCPPLDELVDHTFHKAFQSTNIIIGELDSLSQKSANTIWGFIEASQLGYKCGAFGMFYAALEIAKDFTKSEIYSGTLPDDCLLLHYCDLYVPDGTTMVNYPDGKKEAAFQILDLLERIFVTRMNEVIIESGVEEYFAKSLLDRKTNK